MTPLLDTHTTALRICLHRLHALDCTVAAFSGGPELDAPVVRIVAPTSALLDYLDARQVRLGRSFGLCFASLDGCAVAWPASAHLRVDEVEHIEITA